MTFENFSSSQHQHLSSARLSSLVNLNYSNLSSNFLKQSCFRTPKKWIGGLAKYNINPVSLQPSIALGNKVGNGISHLEKKRRKRKMRLPFELRQVEESQSINRPGAQLAYFKVTKTLLGLNIEQKYVNKLFLQTLFLILG